MYSSTIWNPVIANFDGLFPSHAQSDGVFAWWCPYIECFVNDDDVIYEQRLI